MTLEPDLLLFFLALLFIVVSFDVFDLIRSARRTPRKLTSSPIAWSSPEDSLRDFPNVSVIIPVFNSQKTILRTLESVNVSIYPNYEVLVIDDGSQDQTALVLENWCKKTNYPVNVLRKSHGGKASAANLGAQVSQGDILFFLDADSYVVPNFIERSLNILEKTEKGAIDYVQQVSNPQATLWTKISEFERKLLELHPDNFGALFVIKRLIFESYSFADCLSPQYDIDTRLSRANLLKFDPTPVVFSNEPKRFAQMFHRKVRWTYGFFEGAKKNGFEKKRDGFSFILRISLSFIGIFLMTIPFILGFIENSLYFVFPIVIFVFLWIKNLILAIRMGLSLRLSLVFTLYQLYILNLAVVLAAIRFVLRKPPVW